MNFKLLLLLQFYRAPISVHMCYFLLWLCPYLPCIQASRTNIYYSISLDQRISNNIYIRSEDFLLLKNMFNRKLCDLLIFPLVIFFMNALIHNWLSICILWDNTYQMNAQTNNRQRSKNDKFFMGCCCRYCSC